MTTQQTEALQAAVDALEEIALAGMSGSGQETKEGLRDWHARRAYEFIGIAARALEPARAALAAQPSAVPTEPAPDLVARGLSWEDTQRLSKEACLQAGVEWGDDEQPQSIAINVMMRLANAAHKEGFNLALSRVGALPQLEGTTKEWCKQHPSSAAHIINTLAAKLDALSAPAPVAQVGEAEWNPTTCPHCGAPDSTHVRDCIAENHPNKWDLRLLPDEQINTLISASEVHEYHPGAALEFARTVERAVYDSIPKTLSEFAAARNESEPPQTATPYATQQPAPVAGEAVAITDDEYCHFQYVEKALAAIANRQEISGDVIERLDTIAKASARAKYALARLQAVAPTISRLNEPKPVASEAAQPLTVPEGYALVPIEPTPQMRKAAADAWLDCGSRLVLNKAAAAVRAGISVAAHGIGKETP